jgi:hypothetical protein
MELEDKAPVPIYNGFGIRLPSGNVSPAQVVAKGGQRRIF